MVEAGEEPERKYVEACDGEYTFEEVDLPTMGKRIKENHGLGRYTFIHDTTKDDRTTLYFEVEGQFIDMEKELIRYRAMKEKSREDVCENLRSQTVKAMRMGRTLALSFGKLKADLTEEIGDAATFDTDLIFDRQRFFDDEKEEYL